MQSKSNAKEKPFFRWLDNNDLQHFPHPAFSQEEWSSIKELYVPIVNFVFEGNNKL
jgi:hypothetical protein